METMKVITKLMTDPRGVGLELALIIMTTLIVGVMVSYWLYNTWRSMPKSIILVEGEPIVSGGTLYIAIRNVGTSNVIIYKVIVDDKESVFTLEAIEGNVQGNSLSPEASALLVVSNVLGNPGDRIKFVIISNAGTLRGTAVVT